MNVHVLPQTIFLVAWLGLLAFFIFRAVKFRGLAGGLFGAAIKRTVGEVQATPQRFGTTVLRVDLLESDAPDRAIGLELVSRGAGSYSLRTMTLSVDEALRLIDLLQQSLRER